MDKKLKLILNNVDIGEFLLPYQRILLQVHVSGGESLFRLPASF